MKTKTFKCEYDVIVCGAGVAGVAAALECARSGMKTALIEKTILPGGLATSGLINIYLPLCEGMGHQALFGITEELLKSSIKYGPGKIPEGWRTGKNIEEPKRYRVAFSPAAFVLAIDELMEIQNLEIWYDTLVCAAVMKKNRISGVEVENKSGRGIINASCIIDATGDADIAIFAGAEYETGKNWLSIWAMQAQLERAMQAAKDGDGEPLLNIVSLGTTDLNNGEGSPDWYSPKEGIDGKIVSEFTIKNRKMLRLHYDGLLKKNGESTRNNVYPLSLPSMAQFRTTRKIIGLSEMLNANYGKRIDDSVGLQTDWRRPNYVWELPYGSLLPRRIKGLIAAGRCISCESGDSWQVSRVIPNAALTGQLAGIAATMSVSAKTTPDTLAVADVQKAVKSKGMLLHIDEL